MGKTWRDPKSTAGECLATLHYSDGSVSGDKPGRVSHENVSGGGSSDFSTLTNAAFAKLEYMGQGGGANRQDLCAMAHKTCVHSRCRQFSVYVVSSLRMRRH